MLENFWLPKITKISWCVFKLQCATSVSFFSDTMYTTTTTISWPVVRDYLGEPVPEETLTHPPSWSSSNLYQLLPSTTIHSILLVQITCLAIFLHNLFPLVYLLVWSTPPHIPYVSSPNVYEDKRYLTQMLVTSTFNKAERSQCPHSSSTNLRLQEPFSNLFGKWRPLLVKCYVKIRLETKRQQNTNWMTNADNYTGQWPQTTENNQLSVKNTDTRRGRIPSEKSPGRLHQR